MQIPSIQHPFYFLAIFTFVAGFPISLMMLFPGLFLVQGPQLKSDLCGVILGCFFSLTSSGSLTFVQCCVSQLHVNPVPV